MVQVAHVVTKTDLYIYARSHEDANLYKSYSHKGYVLDITPIRIVIKLSAHYLTWGRPLYKKFRIYA